MKRNKRFQRSFRRFSDRKADELNDIFGELGTSLGGSKIVEVPTRAGYVYVRLRGNTSELVQAYNNAVPAVYNYPVRLRYENNTYIVVGKDQSKWSNVGNGDGGAIVPLPRHGGQHSLNPAYGMGADVSWIYSRQFMNQLAFPSGSALMLTIEPWFYEKNGQWAFSQNTGTPSFVPFLPTATGSARMALLYLNKNTNALEIVGGPAFSGGITNPATLAQYIPDVDRSYGMPLAAVKLLTGTTSFNWENIYDMRDFYTVSSVAGGIGGGIPIQDSGTPVGTGTTLNFGDNLTATIAGGVVTINGAAGGGGGGLGFVTQNDGVYLATGTVLNFAGDGIGATVSGSVVRVSVKAMLLVMHPTLSSPPVPVENPSGTNWVYYEVDF